MVNLDKKDKKILFELSQNSRQTNKQIAKKIELSEPSTINRIKKLTDNNIIKYFYVITNTAKIGYFHYKVFLRISNMDQEREEKFIKTIKNNENIIWFVSTRGNYDYIISILAKDVYEFSSVYKELTKNFEDKILQRNVCIVEKAKIYSRGYLLNQETKEYTYGSKQEPIYLDEDDKTILKLISTKARKTAVELAKEINISSDKVIYRLNKLINNEFIQGFGTQINLKKINVRKYLISFKLQNFNEHKYSSLKEIVKINQSLQYFIHIVGDHDIELELELQSEEQLDNLFKEIKKKFINELKEYELLEIIEEHKLNYFPFK